MDKVVHCSLVVLLLISPLFCDRIFLVGDSTVATYTSDRYPQAGWGQMLGSYFDEHVTVENRAVGGRSSKSYYDEGRWASVLKELKKGDYVFIQLGHNDQYPSLPDRYTDPDTTYKEYLTKYIIEARAAECIPVLVTSVARATRFSTGTYIETHIQRPPKEDSGVAVNTKPYPDAMRELAIYLKVPLIDLHKGSVSLIRSLGFKKTKELYMYFEPGTYKAYPEGKKDLEHFTEKGAIEMARFIVEGIKGLDIPLAQYLR